MNLFSVYTAVKPVQANNEKAGWMVVNETPFSAFIDDLRRYGLRVAWHNLRWVLRDNANE